jgi:5-methylcytosine-specific restriction endonuclease McrA
MSGDAASKRIQAARIAREFPAILPAVAEGRLHLSAVVLLAPHLNKETAEKLLAAASNKSKAEIELLLVHRVPKPDVPTCIEAVAPPAGDGEQAAGPALPLTGSLATKAVQSASCEHAPGHVVSPAERTKIAALSPGRFALRGTMTQEMHDDLRYAQALSSHVPASRDPMQVLARALREHVLTLEKRRFGGSGRSRRRGHRSTNPRNIPAPVRREVWLRDGGQCAFVSESGRRCTSRERVEIDHLDLVGRRSHPSESGPPTAERLRLCCKAHNQHGAEKAYGKGFMQEKRKEARRKAAAAKSRKRSKEAQRQAESAPTAANEAPPQPAGPLVPRNGMVVTAAELRDLGGWNRRGSKHDEDPDRDVAPWLRALKCSKEEIQVGMELCEAIPDATMEEKLKYALKGITRGLNRKIPCVAPSPSA